MRRVHRLGAEDDIAHADVEVTLDGFLVADATTDLHRNLRKRLDDLADRGLVHRFSVARTVQVHEVQPARTGLDPATGGVEWPVIEHCDLVHLALAQAHALAVLDIYRGNEKQRHGAKDDLTGFFRIHRITAKKNQECSGSKIMNALILLILRNPVNPVNYLFFCLPQAVPSQETKFSSNFSPACWLFSGWNCTAKILARAAAEVNRRP